MLWSRVHGAVYLKTTRTASTSTEVFLAQVLGLQTPVDFGVGPGWVTSEAGITGKHSKRTARDLFYHHMAPSEVRLYLGNSIWRSSIRIANIRNPWDQFVSRVWFWARQGRIKLLHEGRLTRVDIERSLEGWGRARVETEILGVDTDLRATHIIKFENLSSDLTHLCELLGLPESSAHLEHRNHASRPSSTYDYRALYTKKSRFLIQSIYEDWIDYGEYRF